MQNNAKIDVYGILHLKPRDEVAMLKVETTSCLKNKTKQSKTKNKQSGMGFEWKDYVKDLISRTNLN